MEALTDKEIAGELGISEETVAHHLRKLFGKFGVRSRVELVVIYGRRFRQREACSCTDV